MIMSLYYIRKCDLFLNKEKYNEAYIAINKINKNYIEDGFYWHGVYNGYILFMLKSFDESIISFKEALCIIDKAYVKTMITSDDRDYLKEYSLGFLSFMYKHLDNVTESEKYSSKVENLEYNIKNVRKTLFETFPFKDKDKWLIENERRQEKNI